MVLAKVQTIHGINLPLFDKLLESFVCNWINRRALACLGLYLDVKIYIIPLRYFFRLFGRFYELQVCWSSLRSQFKRHY